MEDPKEIYRVVNNGRFLELQLKDGTRLPFQTSLDIGNDIDDDHTFTKIKCEIFIMIKTKDFEVVQEHVK